MLKKVISALIMIIALSVIVNIYMNGNMHSFLNAQSAPTFSLPKGSKVILGKYNNKEIVWDIGNNDNNGSYVLMSSKPLVNAIATYDSSVPVTTTPQSVANRESYCLRYNNGSSNYAIQFCPVTPLKSEVAKIQTNSSEAAIITTGLTDILLPLPIMVDHTGIRTIMQCSGL